MLMLLRLELHDDMKVPDTKRSESRFSLTALPYRSIWRLEDSSSRHPQKAPGERWVQGLPGVDPLSLSALILLSLLRVFVCCVLGVYLQLLARLNPLSLTPPLHPTFAY